MKIIFFKLIKGCHLQFSRKAWSFASSVIYLFRSQQGEQLCLAPLSQQPTNQKINAVPLPLLVLSLPFSNLRPCLDQQYQQGTNKAYSFSSVRLLLWLSRIDGGCSGTSSKHVEPGSNFNTLQPHQLVQQSLKSSNIWSVHTIQLVLILCGFHTTWLNGDREAPHSPRGFPGMSVKSPNYPVSRKHTLELTRQMTWYPAQEKGLFSSFFSNGSLRETSNPSCLVTKRGNRKERTWVNQRIWMSSLAEYSLFPKVFARCLFGVRTRRCLAQVWTPY